MDIKISSTLKKGHSWASWQRKVRWYRLCFVVGSHMHCCVDERSKHSSSIGLVSGTTESCDRNRANSRWIPSHDYTVIQRKWGRGLVWPWYVPTHNRIYQTWLASWRTLLEFEPSCDFVEKRVDFASSHHPVSHNLHPCWKWHNCLA